MQEDSSFKPLDHTANLLEQLSPLAIHSFFWPIITVKNLII